eukprot:2801132-Rhodomonas_salina.1
MERAVAALDPVSRYTRPTRCSVLTYCKLIPLLPYERAVLAYAATAICLRVCYAMRGPAIAFGGIGLCACYATRCTDGGCGGTRLGAGPYRSRLYGGPWKAWYSPLWPTRALRDGLGLTAAEVGQVLHEADAGQWCVLWSLHPEISGRLGAEIADLNRGLSTVWPRR